MISKLQDYQLDEKQIERIIKKGMTRDIDQNLNIDSNKLNVLEYVCANDVDEDTREESWLETGFEAQDAIDYSWINELKKSDPASLENETYVCLINDTRKSIKKGEQVFYHYGPRTNHFLLYNYGFAIENNPFDSFTLEMRIDLDLNKSLLPPVDEMLKPTKRKVNVQKARLKKDQLCPILVCYLRSSM